MSSLPPRQPKLDQTNMSQKQNIQQATKRVHRWGKRDPELFALAFVVCGMFCTAGYFFTYKTANPDAAREFMQPGSVVPPWKDETDTHPGATAAFKYRYKTRQGHMEDSLPIMNQDSRILKDATAYRYRTT